MVPGIDPLTIGSLLVLAAGNPSCELPRRTEINVTPKALDVRYDFSRTLAEMQNMGSDTISPHAFGSYSYTQGLMKGSLTMIPQIYIKHKVYPDLGLACAWFDKIDVVLEIDPTIVIAKEVYEDDCMRRAVKDHELKHVRVDREIINKYAKIVGGKIYSGLKERGFKSEMVNQWALKGTIQRMQQTVYDIANHEYAKMNLERVERQRAIDTKQEYDRVNNKCHGFKEPKSKKSYGSYYKFFNN